MKNIPSPSPGGSSEYTEHPVRKIDAKHYEPVTLVDQDRLDYLLGAGFLWEEAVTLLNMREHIYENAEMRQRMEGDYRMHFVRWLHENGEINEN